MALAALQARRAARLENERLEQRRVEDEKERENALSSAKGRKNGTSRRHTNNKGSGPIAGTKARVVRGLTKEILSEEMRKRRKEYLKRWYDELFEDVDDDTIAAWLLGAFKKHENPVAEKRSWSRTQGIDCMTAGEELSTWEDGGDYWPPDLSIKVLVGSDANRVELLIPKDRARGESDYFKDTLQHCSNNDEQQQQQQQQTIVVLPDVGADIFELFANFLRFGKILSREEGDMTLLDPQDRHSYLDHEWPRLAHAWLLGEKIRATGFKDAVIDAIILKAIQYDAAPVDMYQLVYVDEVPRYCGIRKLLVDLALHMWDRETADCFLTSLDEIIEQDQDFFRDLADAREALDVKPELGQEVQSAPCFQLGCHYHDHVLEGKACYRETVPDLWVTSGRPPVSKAAEQEEAVSSGSFAYDESDPWYGAPVIVLVVHQASGN